MKRSVILVGLSLLVSAGCIDFGKTENDFCAGIPSEQWATACQDKAGSPTKLMITSQALSLPAASCSGEVVVQASDDADTAVRVVSARIVNLTSVVTNPVRFFSDAACMTEVTRVTIGAGLSSASVYVAGSIVGASRIIASADGLASASQDLQIVPAAAGRPTKLGFTSGAQVRTAGDCSNPVNIQAQDGLGNPVILTTSMLVDLSGSAGMTFYSDASCTSGITQISIPASGSTANFYFKGTKAGAVDVRVTAAALPISSQTETINPGIATRLVFAIAPLSVGAGSCSGTITVQARDAFDNQSSVQVSTGINFSAAPSQGFTFYAEATCATGVTRVTMPGGGSSVSVYVSGTTAGLVTLTAAATGFSNDSLNVTVNPGPPATLAFATGPQTVNNGVISGPVTVQVKDAFGNLANVSANTYIDVSISTANGSYYNSICTSVAGGCTSNSYRKLLSVGQNLFTFYFQASYCCSSPPGTTAGITCALSSIPSSAISQSETINP